MEWKPADGHGSERKRGLYPPRGMKFPAPEARAGLHLPGKGKRFAGGQAPSSPSVLVPVRVLMPCWGFLLYACCSFLYLVP